MKKIIFILGMSLVLLSSVSVSAQTISEDTSQVAQDILKLKAQNDTLKMEFEKVKKGSYEKAIEGANRSISIANIVMGIVAFFAGLVGLIVYLRIRELKADYKDMKAELMKRFEEDLARVKEYKDDTKKICDEIKERRVFAEREIQEIENFKKNMQVQQEKVPTDFSKDVSELAKKDSKTAIEDYEKIMNKIFDEEIYHTMAYNYYVEKKYDESISELKKAIRLNPKNYGAYYNWALVLDELGRHEEAIEKCKQAIELKPDFEEAYNNWGAVLEKLGRREEAIEKYKKAIELKPDYAMAYYNWGVTLGKLGRYEEAIEKYKKAIEFKPDFAEAYVNWGVTLGKLGRQEEAIEKYKKAIELKPDYAEAYLNWGVALGKLGKHEEEMEKYEKARELKPDEATAWFNIACVYALQNKKKEALESLKRAIELDPKYKEIAKKDEYFKSLWQDGDFKKLVE